MSALPPKADMVQRDRHVDPVRRKVELRTTPGQAVSCESFGCWMSRIGNPGSRRSKRFSSPPVRRQRPCGWTSVKPFAGMWRKGGQRRNGTPVLLANPAPLSFISVFSMRGPSGAWTTNNLIDPVYVTGNAHQIIESYQTDSNFTDSIC